MNIKKLILIISAISIPFSLASCKTNTNNLPNSASSNQASYSHKSSNGAVTDGNGFIGDNDDLIIGKNNNGIDQIGDTVQNIADDIGNSIKDATR